MKKYLTQRYKWRIALDFVQIERRKNMFIITNIKESEAVDAEQLIAKSNSYVEYQLIQIKKRNIVIINVYSPLDCPT